VEPVENAAEHRHHVVGVDEESLPVERNSTLVSDYVEGLVRAVVH
jgi:hypothetical protein